jgi:hypothetical protein
VIKVLKKIESALIELFKDDNSVNEKSVIGFLSFVMMVITLLIDLYTGVMGYSMPIHEFVFDGFLYITLGSLGIASVDKIWGNKKIKEQ